MNRSADVDYAMLVKIHGEREGVGNERRYSPAVRTETQRRPLMGDPDERA